MVWIVSVGLAICGIAAVFFLLVQPTRQAGPTAALHWNPAFGSVSDAARASTELTAQLSTTIASYDDSSSQVAPIPPASPGAAAPTATPVAAMAPRETAGAPPAVASPPQHRTESQAGASTAAIGSEPTAATVEVGPPKKPVTVDAPYTGVPVREPPATAATLAVAAASGPQPASARLSTDEVAALLARGDALLSNGDIASARLFYERAAGDAQAALRLGETYDAAFLARAHLSGARGDAAAAAQWYQQASRLGAAEAEILLIGVAATGRDRGQVDGN